MSLIPQTLVRSVNAVIKAGSGASSYRCPGCGEIVDSRQADQMLHHHQHVIVTEEFPSRWFQQSGGGSHESAQPEAARRLQAAR